MRVLVIVKSTPISESGALPTEESLAEMGKFNQELVEAGVMLAGEGLHPTSKGKRIKFHGAQRTVIDGPFGDPPQSLVAGFWIWKVESIQEALRWLERCPDPFPGEEGIIEVRQLFETEDFAASDPSGDLRRKEEELRKTVEARAK